jgi:hypothetical protein
MNPFAQWGVMFPSVQRFTPHLSTRTTPNLLDLRKFPRNPVHDSPSRVNWLQKGKAFKFMKSVGRSRLSEMP